MSKAATAIFFSKFKVADTFRRLPYIIHKKCYLIPQIPLPRERLAPLSERIQNILAQFHAIQPKYSSTPFKQSINVGSEDVPVHYQVNDLPVIIRLAKQKKNLQSEEMINYMTQLMRYHTKYTEPIKKVARSEYKKITTIIKLKPQLFENHLKQMGTMADKMKKREAADTFWSNLTNNQRQELDEVATKYFDNIEEARESMRSQYRLPIAKIVSAQKLYFQTRLETDKQFADSKPDARKTSALFNALSVEEQMKYKRASQTKFRNDQNIYQKFLASYNITDDELQTIKGACANYDRLVKDYKQAIKDQKYQSLRSSFAQTLETPTDASKGDSSSSVQRSFSQIRPEDFAQKYQAKQANLSEEEKIVQNLNQ